MMRGRRMHNRRIPAMRSLLIVARTTRMMMVVMTVMATGESKRHAENEREDKCVFHKSIIANSRSKGKVQIISLVWGW